MTTITEKKLKKIVSRNAIQQHIKLVKWLYDNHKDILREYEATLGTLRIEFVGGKDV